MMTTTNFTTDLSVLTEQQVDLRESAPMSVGDPVEVLSRFDSRWLRGFSVAVVGPDAYQLRRLSDGAVLPAWFPTSHVRPLEAEA